MKSSPAIPEVAPEAVKPAPKPTARPAPAVSDKPVPLAGAEADFTKAESYAAADMKVIELRRYAVTSMRAVVENYKTKDPRWAEKAQMRIGQIYEQAGETNLALAEYARLFDLFPQGVLRADAQYRIAECLKPGGFLSGLDFSLKEKRGKAIDAYAKVYKDYPASPHAPKALFQMGLLQEGGNTAQDYETAIVSFENIARDYPKSDEAPHAMLRVAELCKTRKVKQYDKAIQTYEDILARYADHEEEFHILLNIALVKENLLNDPKEAIEGYRRVIREKQGTKDALDANRRYEAILQAAQPAQ
jgi:TolA-binding protein